MKKNQYKERNRNINVNKVKNILTFHKKILVKFKMKIKSIA